MVVPYPPVEAIETHLCFPDHPRTASLLRRIDPAEPHQHHPSLATLPVTRAKTAGAPRRLNHYAPTALGSYHLPHYQSTPARETAPRSYPAAPPLLLIHRTPGNCSHSLPQIGRFIVPPPLRSFPVVPQLTPPHVLFRQSASCHRPPADFLFKQTATPPRRALLIAQNRLPHPEISSPPPLFSAAVAPVSVISIPSHASQAADRIVNRRHTLHLDHRFPQSGPRPLTATPYRSQVRSA